MTYTTLFHHVYHFIFPMSSYPVKILKNEKSPPSNLVTENIVWDGEKNFINCSQVEHYSSSSSNSSSRIGWTIFLSSSLVQHLFLESQPPLIPNLQN